MIPGECRRVLVRVPQRDDSSWLATRDADTYLCRLRNREGCIIKDRGGLAVLRFLFERALVYLPIQHEC